MNIAGDTSTGSKRPAALFGDNAAGPRRMVRAHGCRVWDEEGKEYLDTIMALGAVALGYGHEGVVEAVERAARDGIVGALPPVLEQEVAARLTTAVPGTEAVRFFKTGAEAVAAAVRIARVVTGRDRVVTCGYHGWLDWCQEGTGVPRAISELRVTVPFNDVPTLLETLAAPPPVAAIVIEPVIEEAPDASWLRAARETATRHGAVLIFDEIKTALRIARGGAAERYGVVPDLTVVGKALGNGLPIAAVCGSHAIMEAVMRSWISSTLATEYVSLAAARAVLDTYERAPVVEHIGRVGKRFWDGLARLAVAYPTIVKAVRGIPEMCFLVWQDEDVSGMVARDAAARGVLFKRSAYNFVSLAHTDEIVDEVLQRLEAAVVAVERAC